MVVITSSHKVATLWELVGTLWEPVFHYRAPLRGDVCTLFIIPIGFHHDQNTYVILGDYGRCGEVTTVDQSSNFDLYASRFDLLRGQAPLKPEYARTPFELRSSFPFSKVIL
jgi:hypothetical protein